MADRRAELEAAIDEDPEDPRLYAVYGDWLQEQGDPRGELIALQQAAEHDPAVAGPARACFETQLGSFGDYAGCEFTWRHGFVRRATLGLAKPAPLRALLAHPSGRFIVDLSLWERGDSPRSLGRTIEVLLERPRPALRSLSVVARTSDLPTIRSLLGEAFPHLTRLAILAAPFADELVVALCAWPGVRRLRVLDLAGGRLTDLGVAHLARHAEALAQLDRLDLQLNTLGPSGVSVAAKLARTVDTTGQQRPR